LHVKPIALAFDRIRQEGALATETHGCGDAHLVGRDLHDDTRRAEVAACFELS
jgi:hypothetical protein